MLETESHELSLSLLCRATNYVFWVRFGSSLRHDVAKGNLRIPYGSSCLVGVLTKFRGWVRLVDAFGWGSSFAG